MKKILSVTATILLVATSASAVVACGAADGPVIPFSIYDGAKQTKNDVYGTSFDGKAKAGGDYNYAYTSFDQLSLPILSVISSTAESNHKTDKGIYFSPQVAKMSLGGQQTRLENNNPAAQEFFKHFHTSDDTFFTNINLNFIIKSSTGSTVITPLDLASIPYYKNFIKKDYFKNTDDSKYEIGNAIPSLVTFKYVKDALDVLNSSYLIRGDVKKKDNFIQQGRSAIVELPPIQYQFTFTDKNKSWNINVVLKNLVAKFSLVIYQIDKDYHMGWVFENYDYYSNNGITYLFDKSDQGNNNFILKKNVDNVLLWIKNYGFGTGLANVTDTLDDKYDESKDYSAIPDNTFIKGFYSYPEINVYIQDILNEKK